MWSVLLHSKSLCLCQWEQSAQEGQECSINVWCLRGAGAGGVQMEGRSSCQTSAPLLHNLCCHCHKLPAPTWMSAIILLELIFVSSTLKDNWLFNFSAMQTRAFKVCTCGSLNICGSILSACCSLSSRTEVFSHGPIIFSLIWNLLFSISPLKLRDLLSLHICHYWTHPAKSR